MKRRTERPMRSLRRPMRSDMHEVKEDLPAQGQGLAKLHINSKFLVEGDVMPSSN